MTQEIVKFEGFALARVDEAQLSAALDANLAGQQVEMGDLDRVKIPSGGGITWEVPTLTGVEPTAKLRVVVIHHKLARAYWKVSMDESGGGTPPDCSSPDNVWGYGDPGDALRDESKGCDQCPLSQFGSDPDSRGQACKQMHMLFVVGPDELLPMALALPPTSLKAAKQFLWRLSSKARPYYSVVIEIGLEKVAGNGTPDYARATFNAVEILSPEDTKKLKDMSDKLRPVFDRVRVVSGDDVDRGAMAGSATEDPAAPPRASSAAAEAAIPDDADEPLT